MGHLNFIKHTELVLKKNHADSENCLTLKKMGILLALLMCHANISLLFDFSDVSLHSQSCDRTVWVLQRGFRDNKLGLRNICWRLSVASLATRNTMILLMEINLQLLILKCQIQRIDMYIRPFQLL